MKKEKIEVSSKSTKLDNVMVLMKNMEKNKFYGSFEIKFEAGNIVILKKIETLKI
mgnify:CR=1